MNPAETSVLKDPREARAAVWLASFGHRPEKIPEKAGKTPDFRVHAKDGGLIFYVEVKTIESPGDAEPLLWDPLYNTISKRIRVSRKQFASVDPKHQCPRVMLFLSEDMRVHGQTLVNFFTSQIAVGDEIVRDLNRFRFGRAREDVDKIDLFVVLDRGDSPTFFYNQANAARFDEVVRLFVG